MKKQKTRNPQSMHKISSQFKSNDIVWSINCRQLSAAREAHRSKNINFYGQSKMNEQKDATIQQMQPAPFTTTREDSGSGSDGLSVFFNNLNISPESIAAYKTKLAALGLNDVAALRNQASISFLQEQVDVKPEHVHRIMRKLYEIDAHDVLEYAPYPHHAVQSIPPVSLKTSFLTKENVVILREIGHGASGRVFKALFVPTLTLIAIKYVEVKGAIEQRIVAQELKSLYEVALCDHIGGRSEEGSAAAASDVSDMSAHSPYVIGFYGAVSRLISVHAMNVIDYRSMLDGYCSSLSSWSIVLLSLS
jgi:hypothetical protein